MGLAFVPAIATEIQLPTNNSIGTYYNILKVQTKRQELCLAAQRQNKPGTYGAADPLLLF